MPTRDSRFPGDDLLDDEDDLDSDEDLLDDDYEDDADEPEEAFADADAFIAAEVQTATPARLRLYGVTYMLPPRVPLSFNLLLARHQDDESMETFAKVLAPLFGEDALQYWLDKGIDDRLLSIVLAWSIANIKKPGCIDFAGAAKAVDEQDAAKAAEGKARNRAERRTRQGAGSGGPSSSTGSSSKPISGGSTSSRRKRSRR
ncbi:hypothetical protein [Kitasatospora purpeofusca]|uniref:hypothetical protein n=1 Tax=Kitasatospora purpeofusca TaxID=67352 RepID=UPI0036535ED5